MPDACASTIEDSRLMEKASHEERMSMLEKSRGEDCVTVERPEA